jgi:RimJ/RimL family protein N-acetyltransferase
LTSRPSGCCCAAFAVDDFDAHAALWADPVVTQFIGGKPQSREEAWNGFIRHFGMWTAMGFGFWAVIDKASGRSDRRSRVSGPATRIDAQPRRHA